MNDNSSKPFFTTILAARPNNARPSELEVYLREHCQKLSVQEWLQGAHLVVAASPSIAVRVYYPINLQALETPISVLDVVQNPPKHPEIEAMVEFSKHFQVALVLFVLPPPSMVEYLSRMDSFVHRAMQTLSESSSARVLVVGSTDQAVQAIVDVANVLSRGKQKRAYFERAKNRPMESAPALSTLMLETLQLSPSDTGMMLSFIPSLESLIGDMDALQAVPCDPAAQHAVWSFFHDPDAALGQEEMPNGVNYPSQTPGQGIGAGGSPVPALARGFESKSMSAGASNGSFYGAMDADDGYGDSLSQATVYRPNPSLSSAQPASMHTPPTSVAQTMSMQSYQQAGKL